MTSNAPLMFPMDFHANGRRRIVCVNLHSDPAEIQVWIPNARRIRSTYVIFPLERPKRVACQCASNQGGLQITAKKVRLPRFGLWIADVDPT